MCGELISLDLTETNFPSTAFQKLANILSGLHSGSYLKTNVLFLVAMII
jgi:hypothetical protein